MSLRPGISLRPGRNLLALAAAGVVLSALAFYLPAAGWLLLPVWIAAGVLSALDAVWLKKHQADLVVSRKLEPIAGRDVPFEVTLSCVNRGTRPLHGSVREVAPAEAWPAWWSADFPPEGIRQAAEFRQAFRIPTRGSFQFGPAWVRLAGPFRMLEGMWQAAGQSRVKVFPEGLAAKDDLSQHLLAEIQVLDRHRGPSGRAPERSSNRFMNFALATIRGGSTGGRRPARVGWSCGGFRWSSTRTC